jgi:sugar phosphate isomerase/epimerase
MQLGVADYGMVVWEGGLFDLKMQLEGLKAIQFGGIERLNAQTEADALSKALLYREMGMDFGTVNAPTPELCIHWSAALGKEYVWTASPAKDMETYCRHTNVQIEAAARYGIRVGVHNHLGCTVESQEELETFLEKCPKAGIILDTAHLAAAGGDPTHIMKRYADRVIVLHLKDWMDQKPAAECDHWMQRGYFCGLGKGNIGLDNIAFMKAALETGYDGWIFIEHDTHLQDCYTDLKLSREYLEEGGVL